MPCSRTQQAKLPDDSPRYPLNAERQAGKLWIPFCKVFWYESTWGIESRFIDHKAHALAALPLHHRVGMNSCMNVYIFCMNRQLIRLFYFPQIHTILIKKLPVPLLSAAIFFISIYKNHKAAQIIVLRRLLKQVSNHSTQRFKIVENRTCFNKYF